MATRINPELLQTAPINVATAGDATIVPAVAGKRIKVVGYVLVAGGSVSVTWKSNATPLSGPLSLAANGGVSAHAAPPGFVLRTNRGEGLVLNLSGSVQVGGHITYYLADMY